MKQETRPVQLKVADEEEEKILKELQLIHNKIRTLCFVMLAKTMPQQVMSLQKLVAEKAAKEDAVSVIISAALEAEIAQLDDEERTKGISF